jgi:uncharacterized Ntn-hydrolase superfamily protein
MTYTVVARRGRELASLTVSPSPGVGKRAVWFGPKGVAVVQALSSRELARRAYELLDEPETALEVVLRDPMAGYRQALLVPREGEVQAFTGAGTVGAKGFVKARVGETELYCIGNGLASARVLIEACSVREEDPLKAVFDMAFAAEAAGGNATGSKSAALVYLGSFELFHEVEASPDPVKSLWSSLVAPTPLLALGRN